SDEFHFHFVEFAVFRAAGGCERNAVLVAEKSGNAAENVGDFAVELWEPRESTGLLRKSTKLILGLQIIHMRVERAARFEKVRPGFTQADAEDGNVTSTKSFHCLIESVLGKGVQTAGSQKNGFFPFHVLEALGRVDQRIKHYGFAETREIK